MKSLKITLAVAVVCAIFASLTPQDNQPHVDDDKKQAIVKVTFKKEKKKYQIPRQS